MPTTIGTRAAVVTNPRSCTLHHCITPSHAASPNAEPPLSTTASICATVRVGSSSANSRVAGAPPRTSPDATEPSGTITTVQPVRATASVWWPTSTPRRPRSMGVRPDSGSGVKPPSVIAPRPGSAGARAR
jgi:hypothetical protein